QAILGGVVLVGEMPNTNPPVDTVEVLEEKARRVPGRAATDVLLYAGIGRPSALRRLATRAGAFKVFLSPTTGVPDPPAPDALPGLLRTLAELELPVSVHAEDPAEFVDGPPPRSPADWNRARPLRAELAAVARLTPSPPRLRLHVAHVTSAAVADALRAAGVSFEATPHHLLLHDRSR
ncbi:dihydroorotase, multifunctional complex type, partial [mine drainage metagenome]